MSSLDEMRAEEAGWWSGYHDGQRDALTWLDGKTPPDEDPTAPIAADLTGDYAMWCLASNLAQAGAMQAMFDLGHESGWDARDAVHSSGCYPSPSWQPNTEGRRAP